MENIMKPEPHKIIHGLCARLTAEFTIRVACDKDPGYGQFFQLSLPKIGEAPISVCGKGPGYVEFTIRKVGRLTGGVFDLKAGRYTFSCVDRMEMHSRWSSLKIKICWLSAVVRVCLR